jgi:hypothetical protein
MSFREECNGFTLKGKKCTKKTKNGYCKYHISQKKGESSGTTDEIMIIIDDSKEEEITTTVGSSIVPECCICTDPIKKDEKRMNCECNADIHQECVIKSGKNLCPVCRRKVNLTTLEKKRMEKHHDRYKRETTQEEFRRFREQHQDRERGLSDLVDILERYRFPFLFPPQHPRVPPLPRRGYMERENNFTFIIVIDE